MPKETLKPKGRFDDSEGYATPEYVKDITHAAELDIRTLKEKVSNLDNRLNYEITSRNEIIESNKKDTQWKITLFVTIVLAILALIFKK